MPIPAELRTTGDPASRNEEPPPPFGDPRKSVLGTRNDVTPSGERLHWTHSLQGRKAAVTTPEQPLRSLRTKLVVAVLTATSIGLVAALAVTIVGVNSFMYSRLQTQTTNYLRLLADELTVHPGPDKKPPPLVARGEWVALVVAPSGGLKQYWGVRPAKVPTPPVELLRTMAADHSVVRLPGSQFLGATTTLQNGDYVVGAVSTEDYEQIAHRVVV